MKVKCDMNYLDGCKNEVEISFFRFIFNLIRTNFKSSNSGVFCDKHLEFFSSGKDSKNICKKPNLNIK